MDLRFFFKYIHSQQTWALVVVKSQYIEIRIRKYLLNPAPELAASQHRCSTITPLWSAIVIILWFWSAIKFTIRNGKCCVTVHTTLAALNNLTTWEAFNKILDLFDFPIFKKNILFNKRFHTVKLIKMNILHTMFIYSV